MIFDNLHHSYPGVTKLLKDCVSRGMLDIIRLKFLKGKEYLIENHLQPHPLNLHVQAIL